VNNTRAAEIAEIITHPGKHAVGIPKMSDIEKAIETLEDYVRDDRGMRSADPAQWTDEDKSCENLCVAIETAIALITISKKAEREKKCAACKNDVYDDFCRYYGTHGCGKKHFEPRKREMPENV
jgi:hypothetical protein